MESKTMNKQRIETFATGIKDWNQKLNGVIVVCIVAFLIMLTLFSLVINEKEVLDSHYLWLLFAMIVLSMIGSMYVLWFFISYFTVNGRDGKVMQGVTASVEYMPFSMEEYIQFVYARLKQTFWGIGFASFVIIFLGSFGYVHYDSMAEEMKLAMVEVHGVSQVVGFAIIAAFETAFLLIMMNLWFCLIRYLMFRMEADKNKNGRARKGQEDNPEYRITESKNQSGKIGKVVICVLLFVIVIFLGKSVLSDDDPVFGLGIFVMGIIKLCVDYWFFSIPAIGLIVVSAVAFFNNRMVTTYRKDAGAKEKPTDIRGWAAYGKQKPGDLWGRETCRKQKPTDIRGRAAYGKQKPGDLWEREVCEDLKPIDDRKIQKARIILWWLLLAAIAIIGIPLMLTCCYELHYGAYSVYEIKNGLLMVGTVLMLLFLSLVLGLGRYANEWRNGKMVREMNPQNEERDSFETRLNVNLITGVLAISVVVVSGFFYQCFTPEGIEIRQFSNVNSYTWEDVESYTFRAALGGYLVIDFEMMDGEKVSYKELGTSCTSEGYEDRTYLNDERFASKAQDTLSGMDAMDYYDSTETYIMWMTAKLAEHGAVCETADWDELDKELRGGYDSLMNKLQEIVG